MTNRWLLPENIADILPFEARKVEELRRAMLDVFQGYGYELVIPPMLEFRESLLTGAGSDLDLKMFKIVDQLSGRTMGLRADTTPQVARIDAHLLNRPGITRLCYAGTTLQTRVFGGNVSREQLQIGAELYGYSGWEADLEVVKLMLEVLSLAKLGRITLDLSHAGLISEAIGSLSLEAAEIDDLYQALQAKDAPSLKKMTAQWTQSSRDLVLALLDLSGDAFEVLELAKKRLPSTPAVQAAILDLERLCRSLVQDLNKPQLNIDLADLRGYQYHTGMMCAAYVEDSAVAVARGGRYDQVGKAFGRSRPATGFSMDVIAVARLSSRDARRKAILAPWSDEAELSALVAQLRANKEVVIQLLPGQIQDAGEFQCDRQIIMDGKVWKVVPMAH